MAKFKVGDKVYIRWKDGQTEYGKVVGFKPDGKVIMAPDAFKGVGQIVSEESAFHLANAEAARNAEPIPDLVRRIMKLYFKGKLKDAKALYQKNIGMRDLMMAYMKHEGMRAENLDRIFTNAACNAKWVILYRDGGKEKIDAPTHDAAKKVADERSRKSGRGYVSVIVDDGVDYGVNSVCSRNAVTDKSWDGKQLSVGDWVRQKDSGLFGRIVGKYNNYLWNVKWRDGNDTFVEGAAPDDLVFMRHDTSSINSVCSRNAVVQKALNAARNATKLPAKGSRWTSKDDPGFSVEVVGVEGGANGERVKVRGSDGSYDIHPLYDFVRDFKAKNACARNGIQDQLAKVEKMVGRKLTDKEAKSATTLLDAGEPVGRVASAIQAMTPNDPWKRVARNGVWETESKLEREIASKVGADVDVGIDGRAVAIGSLPDEKAAAKAKDVVSKALGAITSWQVKKDEYGYVVDAKLANPVKNVRSRNAVVQKALNAVAQNYDVKPGWTIRWNGELKPGTKITVVDTPVRYGGMTGEVVRRERSYYVVRLDDIAGMEVRLNPNQISVKNAVARNSVNLGNGIVLKSKEAEEAVKLLRSKGYAVAKKYVAEKKAAIEAVDGHRMWYFLDAALDAGKMAGFANAERSRNAVVAKAMNAVAVRNVGFKVGDEVKVDAKYSSNINGGVGVVKEIQDEDVVVEFKGHGTVRVPSPYAVKIGNSAAVRNGYATIRRASGGTAQVREGDEVIYKGEKCRVLRLDDPVGHALIEDDGGREYTPRYSELKAV